MEIWEKTDDNTIEVDVWVYDPPALLEPWYVGQRYAKVPNDDKAIRIYDWNCFGNQNNDVIETEEGGTTYRDFSFTDEDDL